MKKMVGGKQALKKEMMDAEAMKSGKMGADKSAYGKGKMKMANGGYAKMMADGGYVCGHRSKQDYGK